MENKAYELIADRTEEVLEKQEFHRQKETVQEAEGEAVYYIGENSAYSIIYKTEEKQFVLRNTLMTDEGPDDKNWKVLSNWIFDSEIDTMKNAESIANDFCATLDDSKRRAAIRTAKRKASKDEDNNPGPVFFFKRLVNVMPELREEIAWERESYEEFRAVTFAKANIVPKIDILARKKGSAQLKKLCGLMEEFYKIGDLDVRSIITIVIFNGVSDPSRENLLEGMSDSFRKYYKRAAKYKNKTVKPERTKKILGQSHGSASPERLPNKAPKQKR